ncbi:uncharacterized protein MELLADRAFT_95851 [Melampsora larici-populina 98AG31]|uniref:F-box domain-containing protein n=1 Tax=Melampsora larici-populina (strain 98AG31 / pathotype 3-4-7) TaxID=747676 RepID=F4RDH0_MELLP|nr:uncharacterized protein MELLADRAFT_95851 [Melampsora larici-populina 98AG31]EGG09400.1 hypothetical protein MELLADRAFT_95851 [Melampsora larici-populina 98AG31]
MSASFIPAEGPRVQHQIKMPNSRNAKTQLDQPTKIVSGTQRDLLGQLPYEIFFQIAKYLDKDRTHQINRDLGDGNYRQKAKQILTLVSKDSKLLYIYQYNPEARIMSDLQSLSAVNRRMHHLCQPFIWQSLAIPHEVSRPISFWTQEILPKYASYVKEFYALMEDEFTTISHKPLSIRPARRAAGDENQHHFTFRSSDTNKFKFRQSIENRFKLDGSALDKDLHFDHLDPQVQQSLSGVKQDVVLLHSPGLGPKDLLKVLSQCDGFTKLSLQFPCAMDPHPTDMTTNLICNLTLLFSNLEHIQHLKYMGYRGRPIPTESIFEPIKHLPLLESLELANLVEDGGQPNCLASTLQDLKNLKQLSLMHVDIKDNSWGLHKAPPQLVKLKIHDALNPHHPPGLSGHPNVFHPEIHRFSLPALTHLTIFRDQPYETVRCFTGCPNLRHLTVYHSFEDRFENFTDFIISDVFSNLKEIVMPMKFRTRQIHGPALDPKLIPLEDFCKSKGIKLNIWDNCFLEQPFYPREVPMFNK